MNSPEEFNSVRHRQILDALPALVFLERAGNIVYANSEARHMLGRTGEEWEPSSVDDVLWGLSAGIAEPQATFVSNHGSPFHATLAAKGGQLIPVEGTYRQLSSAERDPAERESVIIAHAGERERAPRPKLMEDVLASIPEAVAIVRGSHVLYINAAFEKMFGFPADEVMGSDLSGCVIPETRQHEYAMLRRVVEEQGNFELETVLQTSAGDLVDVALQVAPLMVSGDKAGHVFTFRDIGERKQVESRLQEDALYDVLTGLPNRALLIDHLGLALSRRARRHDQSCGILSIDLDGFSSTNESLGWAAGDALLVEVARRLRAVLRPHDTAARLGRDEFAILVENIAVAADLETVARRVVQEFERPFLIFGHSLPVRVSVGAAMARRDNETASSLLQDAEEAMERAKRQTGDFFDSFEKRPTPQCEQDLQLHRALERREFEIWYQPFYRLATGQVEGFEALFRWRRPDGSMGGFRDLQPFPEDKGMSLEICRYMLESACGQLRVWTDTLQRNQLMLAVNIGSGHFYHEDFVGQVTESLKANGVEPSGLMLEVAESTLNIDPDRAVILVQRLVDCGVRVAVDNFGASLAPLNYLVRLPLHTVKMEPSLTSTAALSGRPSALIRSLIHIGKGIGMGVLAQGVETQEQLSALRRLGCELGQGSLLSLPVDAASAQRLAEASVRKITLDV